jgi:hypothetical protein
LCDSHVFTDRMLDSPLIAPSLRGCAQRYKKSMEL